MEHNADNMDVLEYLQQIDDKLELLGEAIEQMFERVEDIGTEMQTIVKYLDEGVDEVGDE